jgi:nucleotide-binding universal stress UspA family protein
MIKDIAVQLTGSTEDEFRLAHAEALALRHDAHITGLGIHPIPEVVSMIDPTGAAALQELYDDSALQGTKLFAALGDRLSRLAVGSELKRIEAFPGQIGVQLASAARTSDLFVGTRPYGDPLKQERIEEAVLFRSGRGCLFVPPRSEPRPFDTVMIAWKDRREAARAVAEALPLLRGASRVVVTIVEEEGASEQFRTEAGGDIGRYLSRHGVSAEIRLLGGWAVAEEAILNEATMQMADLLVVGAYGHSRFREWLLGGVTRHVLMNAPMPVLTAH